jgi:hypothetical protein
MLKKKVVVKSKKSGLLATETQPKNKMASIPSSPACPSVPSSRVYTLNKPSVLPKKSTYIVNNMVRLNITLADVTRLENELGHKGLLHGIETHVTPVAWNDASDVAVFAAGQKAREPAPTPNPFKTLIKKPVSNIITTETSGPGGVNRKDLIINSGVNRSSKPIMQIYSHGWPAHSSYSCWYCCHPFNTTPIGIPQLLVNMKFHCYGNFCSYNCAKRYLRPETEDDVAMLHTANDTFIDDDLGEKMQLLELLFHMETEAPLNHSIKAAPSRLTLSMFGGSKTIDEFRTNFLTNDSYHVFRSPLVPISYQMEECNDKTDRKRRQRMSLDTIKIEHAFSDLAERARLHKSNGLEKCMMKT